MQAVILAAGEGRRLQPLTRRQAKGMLRVAGRPILAHCLQALASLAPAEVVLVVGRGAEEIQSHFGTSFEGVPLAYVRQRRPSGSAHALLAAAPRLGAEFVVANGDNVFGTDLRPVLARRHERDLAACLLTERVPAARARQGVCVLDAAGRLVSIVEHPGREDRKRGLVVAGFYAFTGEILDACREVRPAAQGEHELSDAVNLLLAAGHDVGHLPLRGWRVNVNAPADLARAERLLSQRPLRG